MGKSISKKKIDGSDVQDKVRMALTEMRTFLDGKGLIMRPIVNFPNSRRVPLLSRISLWVIAKQGGINDLEFRTTK